MGNVSHALLTSLEFALNDPSMAEELRSILDTISLTDSATRLQTYLISTTPPTTAAPVLTWSGSAWTPSAAATVANFIRTIPISSVAFTTGAPVMAFDGTSMAPCAWPTATSLQQQPIATNPPTSAAYLLGWSLATGWTPTGAPTDAKSLKSINLPSWPSITTGTYVLTFTASTSALSWNASA